MGEQPKQLGEDDRRVWELYRPELPMPPAGPVPERPVCDFCSHLDDVENHNVVGYYRLGEPFVVRDFFPPGHGVHFPFAALLGLSDPDDQDVPMDPMPVTDWICPDYFFVCPRHAEDVEADPRYRDRPPQPAAGDGSPTGLVGAFFACRTSDLLPLPIAP